MKRSRIVVASCLAAALVLPAVVWANIHLKNPPPPFYTFGGGPSLLEDGSLFTVNDGEWAVIAFYRPPELADDGDAIDDSFDLLNDFDPNVFDTPLLIESSITLTKAGDLLMTHVRGLGEVPVWFVRVEELEALAADHNGDGLPDLTVDELLSADSLRIGTATSYREENHIAGVHPVSHLTIVASGTFDGGGTFDLRVVEVGLELKQVQINFQD